MNVILGALALLSVVLCVWQWLAGRRFPLHREIAAPRQCPGMTLLKPLKGCDEFAANCLASWLAQNYPGPVQVLFGVTAADDPVCEVVRALIAKHPASDAQLVVCGPPEGANAKVSKLNKLAGLAKHPVLVISDADVRVPPGLLNALAAGLAKPGTGLVNCFYRLENAVTAGMRWEAVAINADFWSQVLQSNDLKPMNFALGAVMALSRRTLDEIGGFAAIRDCLADDYQLGHRIARQGRRIELCPVVVECWSGPMSWREVWAHQLRWARTIRVCQPVPYFFSIVSNATLWPVLWACVKPAPASALSAAVALVVRIATAYHLHRLLAQRSPGLGSIFMPLLKDVLHLAIWAGAFVGNTILWRGERMRLKKDGTLVRARHAAR